MKKEIKYVIFLILALVLAAIIYFSVDKSKSAIVAPLNETATSTPVVNEPVYTKDASQEMMSDEEKAKLGIKTKNPIQVLKRTEDGTVAAYRVITETNPVLEKYGN